MILGLLLWASTSTIALEAEIQLIVDGLDELPALSRVHAEVAASMLLPPSEEVRTWGSRARWKGAVPRLDLALGSDTDLDVRDTFADDYRRTTTDRRGLGGEVALRFDLSSLVFDDAELRAARAAIARSAALSLALERATRIYFERVRVLLELRGDPEDPARLLLEAARLDGLLRALMTGGEDNKP